MHVHTSIDTAVTCVQAKAKIAAEDADMAARIAWQVKTEFDKEAATRAESKKALVEYLKGNEIHKIQKDCAKQKQVEEDVRFMKLYEEILAKQERERQVRLDKLAEWQNKQAIRAESLPESKAWIDPAIIERNWVQNEAKQDAEDKRRKDATRNGNMQMLSVLNQQIAHKAELAAQKKESADAFSKA